MAPIRVDVGLKYLRSYIQENDDKVFCKKIVTITPVLPYYSTYYNYMDGDLNFKIRKRLRVFYKKDPLVILSQQHILSSGLSQKFLLVFVLYLEQESLLILI